MQELSKQLIYLRVSNYLQAIQHSDKQMRLEISTDCMNFIRLNGEPEPKSKPNEKKNEINSDIVLVEETNIDFINSRIMKS